MFVRVCSTFTVSAVAFVSSYAHAGSSGAFWSGQTAAAQHRKVELKLMAAIIGSSFLRASLEETVLRAATS